MEIGLIVAFILLGTVVGFLAGLLGIGGGLVMVPVLTSLFIWQGIPQDQVVHLALGTSMASIIITSISSMRAHNKKGGVLWSVVRMIAPGIVVGAFLATFLASVLSSATLGIFFACFLMYASVQMFLNIKPKPSRNLPGTPALFAAGSVIGSISALVSIGGGTLTVPYLSWHNIDVKKAIGTSAAIGLPISIAGSIGYLLNGLSADLQIDYVVGFIYLPGVILISMMSFFTAPVGAHVAHRLPVPVLKKVFAVLLLGLAIKMIISVI
ncbi:sulfite exporter TauE/SafE family protein [uncultured Amphritea sp.]|uniref:sulfite exporter TauE/SafE family protein n=1 Tax=uncultured Amphritea sp. TaxID=981605 RepID=UPI0026074A2A|nr:sulfite exporter TauE/SafE family protein [uncultured Amphritea sp.]